MDKGWHIYTKRMTNLDVNGQQQETVHTMYAFTNVGPDTSEMSSRYWDDVKLH